MQKESTEQTKTTRIKAKGEIRTTVYADRSLVDLLVSFCTSDSFLSFAVAWPEDGSALGEGRFKLPPRPILYVTLLAARTEVLIQGQHKKRFGLATESPVVRNL